MFGSVTIEEQNTLLDQVMILAKLTGILHLPTWPLTTSLLLLTKLLLAPVFLK